MHEDSRRYHRTRPPTFARAYGQQSSSPQVVSPFGNVPQMVAGRINRQQLSPLLMGLGLGQGKKAQQLQADIASGKASGPLASAIRQIQQFAPGVISGATDIGKQMSEQGRTAVQGLQQAITEAQQQMPEWMAATRQGLGAATQGLTGAQDLYRQMQAQYPGLQQAGQQGMNAAQSALGLAQEAARGPALGGAQAAMGRAQDLLTGGAAQGGAENAVQLAQRYAQQAAAPIANEDLYQMAARRALAQVRPGLAARGLEAGGAGAQMEADTSRDLAYQFAANQAAQRQATLQGLTGATQNLSGLQQGAVSGLNQAAGNLGNITQQGVTGLTNAAQGVQQSAALQGALGQTMLPYLQALQSGGQNIQSAAGQGAQMAMAAPQLASQQANAVNQLGQTLMQQYQLPMQGAGNLLNLLTAGMSPGLSMLQATSPSVANSSKGFQAL
jgi:hypothetical protein